MKKCTFLIPIGSGINGQLISQFLSLQSWCDKNNSSILIVNGKPHNFARNYLATGGKGFLNPSPPDSEWLFWIDSDIIFTIEQIEDMMSIDDSNKFCAGWYRSNSSDQVMCGLWDLDFFNKNLRIPFIAGKWIEQKAIENPNRFIEVDFTGFGFVKMHRDVISNMNYPYFTLNIQKIGDYSDLSSEDVSFCLNCNDQTGIRPKIIPRLQVGHLKNHIY